MRAWLLSIIVCSVLSQFPRGASAHASNDTKIRFERDYDFEHKGDSYVVKALYHGEYRYVCWDTYWADEDARNEDATAWCRELEYMTRGEVYSWSEHLGEVTLNVQCGDDTKHPNDCALSVPVSSRECINHVRLQCMDPLADFYRMQPAVGILIAICGVLLVLCIISWICLCLVKCKRSGSKSFNMEEY